MHDAESVSNLLAGGARLPTSNLPQKRKVINKRKLRAAFVQRVSGDTRKLAVHDLVRHMQTAAEVALFVRLLPDFSKSTKVNYLHMAIEYNNRIMQTVLAGKPLDAYPKNSRELGRFGNSYGKTVRGRDSLLMHGFLQALTPILPPQTPHSLTLSEHNP